MLPIKLSKIADSIFKTAIDFATQDAMRKYLSEHPKADPKKHRVIETEKKVNHYDSREIKRNTKKIQEDIENWTNNESKAIATSALSNIHLKDTEGILLTKDGKSAGIACIENKPDKDYIKIKNIASNEKGFGRKLMNVIFDKALKAEKGVALVSMTTSANKFYEKMGMTPDKNDPSIFRISLEKIKRRVTNG